MEVTFIGADGATTKVDVPEGAILKDVAIANAVEGIIGECGGCAICGTCHVYVEAPYSARLRAPSEDEEETLEMTFADRLPNSRLSCQITMSAVLDGITLKVPVV